MVENKKITYKGFTPYSHQRAVINELIDGKGTSKKIVTVSSRQKGKSFMIANILLYYAINWKTKNFCLSPTLKQAKTIFETIYNGISGSGIVKKANATDLEITLINKSIIKFCSAEQREALRGYTVSGILCIDECCYIPDDIFYTIVAWTDVYKAPILMTSTPYIKDGFFWDYYNYGLANANSTTTINWSDEIYREDIEKILPPSKLEEYRRVMPSNKFKTDYLGEWLDDEGQVFTGFKECVKHTEITDNDKFYVGIDWGNNTLNDNTVISIINQRGEQVLLDYWNNLDTTQQIDRILQIIRPIEKNIVVIQPELTSIGQPYTDLLKNGLQNSTKSKVQGFNTTNQSKADLVSELQVAFEQKKISILDDAKQLRELSYYSAEYNPKTKNVYYNAPNGLHDDTVIALMLSYDAYNNKNKTGVYCVGNANMQKKHNPEKFGYKPNYDKDDR